MWHKPCRTFNPWCLCIKTRCLLVPLWTNQLSCKLFKPSRCAKNQGSWKGVLPRGERLTPICVLKLTSIGSDNSLSFGRRQASAGILLTGPLETNFSEVLIEIHTFPFKEMPLKMSFGELRPFCLGLIALINKAITRCHILSQLNISNWYDYWLSSCRVTYLGSSYYIYKSMLAFSQCGYSKSKTVEFE